MEKRIGFKGQLIEEKEIRAGSSRPDDLEIDTLEERNGK